jgi:hypothetical protein
MAHFSFNAFDAPRMHYERADAQYNTSVITIGERTAAGTYNVIVNIFLAKSPSQQQGRNGLSFKR